MPVNPTAAPGPAPASSRDATDSKTVPKLVLIWVLMTVIVAFKVRDTTKRMSLYNYSQTDL